MLRYIISYRLDVADNPFGGGPSEFNPVTFSVLLAILAIVVVIGIVCLVKAVKSEKRARAMQQSAEFTSQLLNAVTEAQKAAETPLAAASAAPETCAASGNDASAGKDE